MKIKVDLIVYLLMIVFFFPPSIIKVIPNLSTMYNLYILSMTGVSCLIIIIAFMKRKGKFNRYFIWLLLFCVWLILVNFFHMKIGREFLKQAFPILAVTVLINRLYKVKKIEDALCAFSAYGSAMIILNFASQIMCGTDGIYHDWSDSWQAYYICGNANSFVFYYLTFLGIICLYAEYNKKYTIWSYVIHAIAIYSMFYALGGGGSTTGIVIITCFLVVRIINIEAIRSFLLKHLKIFSGLIIVFAIWIVAFNGWKSKSLLNFLQTYLNENASFVARGTIWNNAIKIISSSPITGHGTNAVRAVRDMDGILRSAHNNYLELIIMGGIPCILIYVMVITKSLKNIDIHSKRNFLLVSCISMFLITYMVEQNPFFLGFFIVLSLCERNNNATNEIHCEE